MLLEDCRELLPILRISDERLAVLRANPEDRIRLAIKGYGRWRPLSDEEATESDEHVAVLGPHGRIEITLKDGRTLVGGDTGWRDVTDLAASEDPDVELSLIRRVHDGVQYTQRGGEPLPAEGSIAADSLQGRVFREGTVNDLDALPAGRGGHRAAVVDHQPRARPARGRAKRTDGPGYCTAPGTPGSVGLPMF